MRQIFNRLIFCLVFGTVFSDDLDDNPDINLDPLQIARRHGYLAESHVIATEDGYLLTLHRIPGLVNGTRGVQPVLLQHGLLSSSFDWVINGNESLPFLLANAGYDVWMGNARGNTYSKAHISLSIESSKYWNFSWHEMGYYDLPAVIQHITNVTDKRGELLYAGHSMGTTMFFVLAATRPEIAKNVKLMVALAPVAYMTHVRSPIRYLAPFSSDFEWIAKKLGINEFLPKSKFLDFLSYDCKLLNVEKTICENVLLFALCGFDQAEFNKNVLPLIISHDPSGSSTKTILHYAQEINNNGNFQFYDYGPDGNKIQYGTLTPPLYNLKNIKVKTYLFYAMDDWMSSFIDVYRLAGKLANNVGLHRVQMDTFNHVDYIFGKDAPQLVYEPLLEVFENSTKTPQIV